MMGAQLWFLAYDVRRGGPAGGRQAGYGITAGLLAELATRGRLRAAARRCEIADASPLGCPATDGLLVRIAAVPARSWEDWIRDYARVALATVTADLEDRCRVVPYERRVAWVIALRRHALVDPAGVDRLRSAVRAALATRDAAVAPRLGVLASLAVTARIGDLVTQPGERLSERLEALATPVAPLRRALDAAVRSLGAELSLGRMPAAI